MVSSLFGVHWVMPKGVVELLMSLKEKFVRCPNVMLRGSLNFRSQEG